MGHNKFSLQHYSALAGAFVGLAGSAHAGIVYTSIDPDTIVSDGFYDIDFDGDSSPEFRLVHSNLSLSYSGYALSSNNVILYGNQAIDYGFMPVGSNPYFVDDLNPSAAIGASASFSPNIYGTLAKVFSSSVSGSLNSSTQGGWVGKGGRYIGVSFELSGSTHYGWIRVGVEVDGGSFRVKGLAYEDVAGVSINAGDAGPIICDTPTGLSSTVLTSTSVQVDWAVAAGATQYKLFGRKAGTIPFQEIAESSNTHVLNSLISSTTYEWKVQARCPNGSGGFIESGESTLESFTTSAFRTSDVSRMSGAGVETPQIETTSRFTAFVTGKNLYFNANQLTSLVELVDISGKILHSWTAPETLNVRLQEHSGIMLLRVVWHDGEEETRKILVP
ncbi:MAG: hypothetical protein ACI959_001630 [Limisphaerales bacterium]|jgi:hypothetical protein